MARGRYVVFAYIEQEFGYKTKGTRIKVFNCFGYSKLINSKIEQKAIEFAKSRPYDLYNFNPDDKDKVVFDVEYEEYNSSTHAWEFDDNVLNNVSDHYSKVAEKVKSYSDEF